MVTLDLQRFSVPLQYSVKDGGGRSYGIGSMTYYLLVNQVSHSAKQRIIC